MFRSNGTPGLGLGAIILVALSLSIGWGVRGNWGHEYGAMIPGALAAMAACVVAGRDDWLRRVAYFAFFGALGWSFGGSISYMIVIGFTHSGDFDYGTVRYGFASLFLIGFLWAAVGGAGTALPAVVDRQRLTAFFPPILAVFAAWYFQDWIYHWGWLKQENLKAWFGNDFAELMADLRTYDVDWLAALLAIVAVLILAAFRRRLCEPTRLVLYMAGGWWLGFITLTVVFGLRMTPPRSDNWSGCLGMTAGMFVFLIRHRLLAVAWAGALSGLFGGMGFAGSVWLKLVNIKSAMLAQETEFLGYTWENWGKLVSTNWHSVLEQTFGFISGIGIALTMGYLSSRTPKVVEEPPAHRWTEPFCILFVMLLITFVNIRKNVEAVWLKVESFPKELYYRSAEWWFNAAYLALAITFIWLVWYHRHRRPLPMIPTSWLGRGQLFFLIFLWWIVIGNLSRLIQMGEQRLITEGVIHLNACLCTLLVFLLPREDRPAVPKAAPDFLRLFRTTAIVGTVGAVLFVFVATWRIHAFWGDTFAGNAGLHYRFGPNATHLLSKEEVQALTQDAVRPEQERRRQLYEQITKAREEREKARKQREQGGSDPPKDAEAATEERPESSDSS